LFYNAVHQHLRYSAARPWHQGQRGHPGGLSKGARRKLTDAFIRALARDWQAHGEEVIQRVREEHSVAYFKGMISLLPKEHSIDSATKQTHKVEGLSATAELLEQLKASGVHKRSKPKPHWSLVPAGIGIRPNGH
jgi:hypothetical protein